jgi:hypothetical protein
MEIPKQPTQGPRPNHLPQNEQLIDITRLNREAIQRSTEEFQQAQYSGDSIQLSEEGQALAAGTARVTTPADDALKAEAAHQAKVRDLRQKYVDGKLNTPARVEQAAHKILAAD